jgi:hypothetical protein
VTKQWRAFPPPAFTAMSRNDVILVIRHRSKWYVVPNVNADIEWSVAYARSYVAQKDVKWTRNRGRALQLAHDMQLKNETEYGVRELYLSADQPLEDEEGNMPPSPC